MTTHCECLLAIKLPSARKTGLLIRESDEGRLREVIAARQRRRSLKIWRASGPTGEGPYAVAIPEVLKFFLAFCGGMG